MALLRPWRCSMHQSCYSAENKAFLLARFISQIASALSNMIVKLPSIPSEPYTNRGRLDLPRLLIYGLLRLAQFLLSEPPAERQAEIYREIKFLPADSMWRRRCHFCHRTQDKSKANNLWYACLVCGFHHCKPCQALLSQKPSEFRSALQMLRQLEKEMICILLCLKGLALHDARVLGQVLRQNNVFQNWHSRKKKEYDWWRSHDGSFSIPYCVGLKAVKIMDKTLSLPLGLSTLPRRSSTGELQRNTANTGE